MVYSSSAPQLANLYEASIRTKFNNRDEKRFGVAVWRTDLADRHEATLAVGTRTADVDDDVERSCQLLSNRRERPGGRRLQYQRFQSEECVEWPVGVARRERTVVAGIHCLHKAQNFGPTNLADNEAIGPKPKRGTHQVVEVDGRRTIW
jgi:hypothetical protein